MKQEFTMSNDDLKQLAKEIYQLSKKDADENKKEDILNVKEVAKLFQISPSFIYSMTRARQIPHFKIGRKLYFPKAILLKWLQIPIFQFVAYNYVNPEEFQYNPRF